MLPPFPHRSVGPLVVRAVRRRAASDVVEIPLCELPNICGILRFALAAAAAAGIGAGLRRGSAFVTTRTKNNVDHEGEGNKPCWHDILGGVEARARCSRAYLTCRALGIAWVQGRRLMWLLDPLYLTL